MRLSVNTLKYIIVALTIVACITMVFLEPIPQDPNYHNFADQRGWGFVPHFWNVVTNISFLYTGLLGLYQLHVLQKLKIITAVKLSYSIFFIGVSLVAFGSGYYHWHPSNETLIWDRLPMTLGFMALTSFVLAEFLSIPWGRYSLWPLLLLGLFSVVYWYLTELKGMGDLRLYILVQFLPIILLLVLFIFAAPSFSDHSGYWWLFAGYVLAKILEYFDYEVFELTHSFMAGHALKHLSAALGLYLLLRCFTQRLPKK